MSKPQRIRHKPDPPIANSRHRATRWDMLGHGAILAIALFVGLKPISTDALWWQLARGRAVVAGSFAPSRDLLSLDQHAEADWLGGVLPFALYSFLGASALMAARVAAAIGLAYLLRRRMMQAGWATVATIVMATCVLCETAFDPGPRLFDVGLVFVACWGVSYRCAGMDWRRACITTGLVFACFANVAPHVAAGLLILLFALAGVKAIGVNANDVNANVDRPHRWSQAAIFVSAVAGCCLTPRGIFTLWDSVRLTFPWLVTDSWVLRETPWQPLHTADWTTTECVFLAWSAAFLVVAVGNRSLSQAATLAAVQLLAWPSSNHLPIAGAWLACATVSGFAATGFTATGFRATGENETAAATRKKPVPEKVRRAAAIGVTGLLAFFGSGFSELGWGVHSRLDDRICRLALSGSLAGAESARTAYCDDVLSAGMLCWIADGDFHVQDVPQRALLGGRLAEHILIRDDLRSEHRASYWREDASRGGWWLALAERDTELVLISADDTTMIRALEPTIWKPLALDSPVLPYARAGDRRFAEKMVRVLSLREIVDHGGWVYSWPRTTRSQFDRDWWGWRDDVGCPAAALRQAGVFRGMRLHHAALKVLGASLGRWSDEDLRSEFARCQAELAHNEALVGGVSSQFRRLALREAMSHSRRTIEVDTALLATDLPDSGELPEAVASYVSGDANGALKQLSSGRPESEYAVACLLIELGKPREAVTTLDQIINTARGSRLAMIAEHLRRELEGSN